MQIKTYNKTSHTTSITFMYLSEISKDSSRHRLIVLKVSLIEALMRLPLTPCSQLYYYNVQRVR